MTDHDQTPGKPDLVTHFIAGYPDYSSSLETAKGLIDGGAAALEMQIPFSDPSADGPVIEQACRISLKNGFRVKDAFTLLSEIQGYSDIPVYLMSYSGIVYNMGIDAFVQKAAAGSCSGLIIPDLTPGTDEGLYRTGEEYGIPVIPVVVPGISDSRLKEIMEVRPRWVYSALRSGITGSHTKLDSVNLGFIKKIKSFNTKVMAGFGIKTPEQVRTLTEHCDAAIAGSFIVDRITKALEQNKSVRDEVKMCVEYLLGTG